MEKNEKKMITVGKETFEAFDAVKVSLITERKTSKVNANDTILELIKNREELKELKKRLENQ